jgi:hypothetical protein
VEPIFDEKMALEWFVLIFSILEFGFHFFDGKSIFWVWITNIIKHPVFWGVQLYIAILKVSRHLGFPPFLFSLLDGGNVYCLKGSFVDFARV